MKKILIATSASALAFASFTSSAFAVDVSGYSLTAYKKTDDSNSLYNETEVYFSGSKTAVNGFTFGATYTIGFEGDSASSSRVEQNAAGINPAFAIVTATEAGDLNPAVKGVEVKDGIYRNDYANINAYVSGSFGKIEVGHHDSASKALGTASIASGKSIDGAITGDATRVTFDNAVTITTRSEMGLQVAYTMVPENDAVSSLGIKYVGNVAGYDYAVVFTESTVEKTYATTYPFRTIATGFEVSKGPFSVSYSIARTDDTGMNTIAGTKSTDSLDEVLGAYLFPETETTRFGVGYVYNSWTLGASMSSGATMASDEAINTTDMYVGYSFADSLAVFSEYVSQDGEKTMYLGTNIAF